MRSPRTLLHYYCHWGITLFLMLTFPFFCVFFSLFYYLVVVLALKAGAMAMVRCVCNATLRRSCSCGMSSSHPPVCTSFVTAVPPLSPGYPSHRSTVTRNSSSEDVDDCRDEGFWFVCCFFFSLLSLSFHICTPLPFAPFPPLLALISNNGVVAIWGCGLSEAWY